MHLLAPEIHKLYKIKHHRTAPYQLLCYFQLELQNIETIPLVCVDPQLKIAANLYIAENKQLAYKEHLETAHSKCIYVDDSGTTEGVGAAARYCKWNGTDLVYQYYLGTAAQHTIYEAELVGILLVVQMIKNLKINKPIIIAVDNQAAAGAL